MKKDLRKTKTRLSLGRSMIEMLGVLAIIGVLSIGGLYAYRQAMERYRTNQVISFIPRLYMTMRDICTKSNCPLGPPQGAYYKPTRELICSIIGYDKAVCDGGQWGRLYGLKYEKEITGWIAYTAEGAFFLQFLNTSPDLCAKIVASIDWPIYAAQISSNPGIITNGVRLTPTQKETLEAQCYAKYEEKYICLVFSWKKD